MQGGEEPHTAPHAATCEARGAQLRRAARAQKQRFDAAVRYTHDAAVRLAPEPLEGDVRAARSALRDTYLALVFTCPFTRAAQGVEATMWADTTHAEVAALRAHLAALEREAAEAPPGRRQLDALGAETHTPKSARRSAKVHEYERQLDTLRQFLGEEHAFWAAFAARVVRLFGVDEAAAVLRGAGITDVDDGPRGSAAPGAGACAAGAAPGSAAPGAAVVRTGAGGDVQGGGPGSSGGGGPGGGGDDGPDGDGQALAGHGAVLAAADRIAAARIPTNRTQLLDILQKALIYCGDLARYRAMYAALPAALQRTAEGERAPDFSAAVRFYRQAHVLLPDRGNPMNQLAVVAMRTGDRFLATYEYFRALCVRFPFETARENLDRLLDKALCAWDASPIRDDIVHAWRAAPGHVPVVSVQWPDADAWLASVVVLHALLARRAELDCVAALNEALLRSLLSLTESLSLRAMDHLRVVVTALCASWTLRLWRSAAPSPSPAACAQRSFSVGAAVPSAPLTDATLPEAVRRSFEAQALSHVLGVLTAQLTAVRGELAGRLQAPHTDALGAILRRTLPALRVGFKWVKTHLEYLERSVDDAVKTDEQLRAALAAEGRSDAAPRSALTRFQQVVQSVRPGMHAFWTAYTDVVNLLRSLFPFQTLPNVGAVDDAEHDAVRVEEDAELCELGPVRNVLAPAAAPVGAPGGAPTGAPSPYPTGDEAHRARIVDVLVDAKVIAESRASPLAFDDARNVFVYGG